MRKITQIIIHCSATPAGRKVTVADIDRWHRARGFNGIGYHYLIDLEGNVHPGRPLDLAGAHCSGHNAHSIGICYVGGCNAAMQPADTRTPPQKQALRALVHTLLQRFPGATVHGHREFAAKACPSFDVSAEFAHQSLKPP